MKTLRDLKALMASTRPELAQLNFWVCPICRAERNFAKYGEMCRHCGFEVGELINDDSRTEPYFAKLGGAAQAYEVLLGPTSVLAIKVAEHKARVAAERSVKSTSSNKQTNSNASS